MEGIIFLLIIIVAFNLLNALIKALRGERGGRQRDIPSGRKRPAAGGVKDIWEEETAHFRAKKPTGAAADRESDDEESVDYARAKDEYAVIPPVKSREPSEVASNLKQMLSRKESLAAAIIVHEILKPPPAVRRRR